MLDIHGVFFIQTKKTVKKLRRPKGNIYFSLLYPLFCDSSCRRVSHTVFLLHFPKKKFSPNTAARCYIKVCGEILNIVQTMRISVWHSCILANFLAHWWFFPQYTACSRYGIFPDPWGSCPCTAIRVGHRALFAYRELIRIYRA